jgi:alkanesulfonate monooxygenase SsuD/methylene tetrahydromethanopterin reductase-like flavin-dependent oxidoreductase (luciferase family)
MRSPSWRLSASRPAAPPAAADRRRQPADARHRGREADIVSILPRALPNGTISGALQERSPAAVAQQVDWVRQAAGERFQQVELNAVISVVVANDHRKAAERLAADRGWGSTAAQEVLEMPSVVVGSVGRIAEQMQARRDRYHFSYYVVSDQDMDAFAPVIDRLTGQ